MRVLKFGTARRHWVIALLILSVLTIFVYSKTPSFGFVSYDDADILTNNSVVLNFDLGAMFSRQVAVDRVPITLLTYAIENRFLGGLNPAVYHFDNVLLHVFNTGLVVYVFFLLFGGFWAPLFAGAFFGIHPLHVESVAWITERKDVLSGFFYLLSLCCYLKWVTPTVARRKRNLALFIVFLFYVLATLSKAMALSLPFALLLFDYMKRRPWKWSVIIEKIPLFLFGLVMVWTHPLLKRAGQVAERENFSFLQVLSQVFDQLSFYINRSFIPYGQSVIYEWDAVSHNPIQYAVAFFVFFGLLIYFIKNENRFGVGGLLLFIGTLIPVLRIIPYQNAFAYADRYIYLPSMGLILAVVATIKAEARTAILQRASASMAFVVALTFAVISYGRTDVWKNDESLWDDVLTKYPRTALAHHNRGVWLSKEGGDAEALMEFQKALEINPKYTAALNSLGTLKLRGGDFKAASEFFLESLKTDRHNSVAHYGLGKSYQQMGMQDQALSEFQNGVADDAENFVTHYNLGVAYYDFGKFDEGINEFQKCISLNPFYPEGYQNLGFGYFKKGMLIEAQKEFEKAVQLKPDFKEARQNLELIRHPALIQK